MNETASIACRWAKCKITNLMKPGKWFEMPFDKCECLTPSTPKLYERVSKAESFFFIRIKSWLFFHKSPRTRRIHRDGKWFEMPFDKCECLTRWPPFGQPFSHRISVIRNSSDSNSDWFTWLNSLIDWLNVATFVPSIVGRALHWFQFTFFVIGGFC